LFAVALASFISDKICFAIKEYNILYIILITISISILYFVFMVLVGGIKVKNIITKKSRNKHKKSKKV